MGKTSVQNLRMAGPGVFSCDGSGVSGSPRKTVG